MNISGRDWLFTLGIAALIGILLMSTGTGTAPRVPDNGTHRAVRERLAAGIGRDDVERECAACHSGRGMPLPRKHPPKEQCLICHLLKARP